MKNRLHKIDITKMSDEQVFKEATYASTSLKFDMASTLSKDDYICVISFLSLFQNYLSGLIVESYYKADHRNKSKQDLTSLLADFIEMSDKLYKISTYQSTPKH